MNGVEDFWVCAAAATPRVGLVFVRVEAELAEGKGEARWLDGRALAQGGNTKGVTEGGTKYKEGGHALVDEGGRVILVRSDQKKKKTLKRC